MIIRSIKTNPRTWFWTGLLITIVAGGMVLQTGDCLITKESPHRIISLEMAWTQKKGLAIKKAWADTCKVVKPFCDCTTDTPRTIRQQAVTSIWWDFPFIVTYVLFIMVLLVIEDSSPFQRSRYDSLSKNTRGLLVAAIVAGLCDVVENIFTLLFLQNDAVSVPWLSFFASVKMFLLLGLVVHIFREGNYLKIFSVFVKDFTSVVWTNRISVIGLLVIFVSLWISDQGQDLLINLNAKDNEGVPFFRAKDMGPIFLYLILFILACLTWYWHRFYNKNARTRNGNNVWLKSLLLGDWSDPTIRRERRYVPRLLGVLAFIIPACGILNALDIFQIPYTFNFISPFALLIVTTLFFVWTMNNDLYTRFFWWLDERGCREVYHLIILALVGVMFWLKILNRGVPPHLAYLSTGLYCLALIFVMVTSVRTVPEFYETRWLTKFFRSFKQQRANTWVMAASLFAFVAFIGLNIYPLFIITNDDFRFVTLPAVLTGIVFYTLFFSLLILWGKRYTINFAGFLVATLVIIAISSENNFHDVRTVERTDSLSTLENYADGWMLSRKDSILAIPEGRRYPVFLVNAYGGGVRAAAWTSMVVSHLDSITQNRFQDHVLLYSGASGGTIGASVQCTLRKIGRDNLDPQQVLNFYQEDFLTPVLIGYLGRDVWFFPFGFSAICDRAALQDSTWEYHLRKSAETYYENSPNHYYHQEFSQLWSARDYSVPLLFSNSYQLEDRLKSILAPVSLKDSVFRSTIIVNTVLGGKRSVRVSTGAFLSARFPYVSPAGRIGSYHFMDGGLKENSGTETSLDVYTVLSKRKAYYQNKKERSPREELLHTLYSHTEIYFLSLNNTIGRNEQDKRRHIPQFAAPVKALLSNWEGNTLKADSMLRLRHPGRYLLVRPKDECLRTSEGVTYKPVLPLGWQISKDALISMQRSITDSTQRENRNREVFGRIRNGIIHGTDPAEILEKR